MKNFFLYFLIICVGSFSVCQAAQTVSQDEIYHHLQDRLKPYMKEKENRLDVGDLQKSKKTAAQIAEERFSHIHEILLSIDSRLLTPEFAEIVEDSLFSRYSNIGYGFDYQDAVNLERKYILDNTDRVIPTLNEKRRDQIIHLMSNFKEVNDNYISSMSSYLKAKIAQSDKIDITLDPGGDNRLPKVWAALNDADSIDDLSFSIKVDKEESNILQMVFIKRIDSNLSSISGLNIQASQNLFSLAYVPDIGIDQIDEIEKCKLKLDEQFKLKISPGGDVIKINNSDIYYLIRYIADFCSNSTLKEWDSYRQKEKEDTTNFLTVTLETNPLLWNK